MAFHTPALQTPQSTSESFKKILDDTLWFKWSAKRRGVALSCCTVSWSFLQGSRLEPSTELNFKRVCSGHTAARAAVLAASVFPSAASARPLAEHLARTAALPVQDEEIPARHVSLPAPERHRIERQL